MITKFKIFENNNKEPKIGDFITINIDFYESDAVNKYLSSLVYKVIDYDYTHNVKKVICTINPNDYNKDFKGFITPTFNRYVHFEQITGIFKSKKEAKKMIPIINNSIKYNL